MSKSSGFCCLTDTRCSQIYNQGWGETYLKNSWWWWRRAFKNGLKLQGKYAKLSPSIASFTSKLINDSLKSGFCKARQQKRKHISIILQNSCLFTKISFYCFIIWLTRERERKVLLLFAKRSKRTIAFPKCWFTAFITIIKKSKQPPPLGTFPKKSSDLVARPFPFCSMNKLDAIHGR